MSADHSESGDPKLVVDADFVDNLDALGRDLNDVEALARAALAGQPLDHELAERVSTAPTALSYTAITEHNRERRSAEAWGEADLNDMIDPVAAEQLTTWRAAQRIDWEPSDFAVVGIAGFLGALANLYDHQIDSAVLGGLSWLKKTDFLRRWEKEAARLPIDYTGPKFGGPAHRVRSAGHDIGRFLEGLNQIRSGTFRGTVWENGERIAAVVTTTRSGLPFVQAPELHLAAAVLLKHWAADFVTPMSLPLPGWSLLYDMPDRDLRKFAHEAYAGTNSGDGLNLRSGVLTPGLGMFATELIIRTHTHLTAYCDGGSPRLSTAAAAKRTEMLLAAHAVAGAASLSKTVAAGIAGETILAVRHLNVPVLVRVGILALKVRADAADRATAEAPSWMQILADEASTWTMPEAIAIADLLADSQMN
ncbi:uncharacterized protein RMCC_6581 [Mycolicibacterium canariasense]|uniref:Uncharacterized protein n=1 Tax=Mycolicibacterium canariasense TaxID=228230 RepID=A0A100WK67_MYCCR|nr:hypothetical protein [Mycolicibacterium canariasense]MCV7210552.1 hypothetical protein [Mycolicibacterium canariasense]ORU97891.1 hypothetical protein AWB94_29175 [Mycolicibacterium canariasense]GAS99616.1 uncharacterized protein RMCC_6581 [Mycolicibacterium canariasense]